MNDELQHLPPEDDDPVLSDADLEALLGPGMGVPGGAPMPSSIAPPADAVSDDAAAFGTAGNADGPPAPGVAGGDPRREKEISDAGPATSPTGKRTRKSKAAKASASADPGRRAKGKGARGSAKAATDPAAGEATPRRAGRPVPTATSFDLLNGGFQKARRVRLLILSGFGAVVALALVVAGQGVTAYLTAGDVRGRLDQVSSEVQELQAAIDARSQINGHPMSVLAARLELRRAHTQTAVGAETDFLGFVSELNAISAESGVAITGVSVAGAPATGEAAPTPAPAPAPEQAGAGTPAPTATPLTLVVTGSAPDRAALTAWVRAFTGVGGEVQDFTWEDTSTGSVVNVTVTVADPGLEARRAMLAELVNPTTGGS